MTSELREKSLEKLMFSEGFPFLFCVIPDCYVRRLGACLQKPAARAKRSAGNPGSGHPRRPLTRRARRVSRSAEGGESVASQCRLLRGGMFQALALVV